MANASAKRVASQNEKAIRNLRIGMLVVNVVYICSHFFRYSNLPSVSSMVIWLLPILPTWALYAFIVNSGMPRRDNSGTLLSSGEDLNQPGLLDWSWDIIYITWFCQLGSGMFGSWIWYLYLTIPLYAGYKVWSSIISPLLLGRTEHRVEPPKVEATSSKRQDKLRKRQENRVRSVPMK